MDAAAALADLTEISSQLEHVVVVDADGTVLASTFRTEEAAERLARAARELLVEAAGLPTGAGRELTQLEVALPEASVVVARDEVRTVAATTVAEPTTGLVLYDLRTCLRALGQPEAPEPAPKPAPKSKRPAAKKPGAAKKAPDA